MYVRLPTCTGRRVNKTFFFLRLSLPRQVCHNKKRTLAESLNYLRIALQRYGQKNSRHRKKTVSGKNW